MTAASTFVIVGAGQAGGWAARTLRDEGFEGRIVLIGEEDYAPYERPPLSKALLLGEVEPESCALFADADYRERDIEFRLGRRVTCLLPAEHRIELDDGSDLDYHRLMLATGARPRPLPVPGADLAGIHYLRTIPDALAIRGDVAAGKTALIVGGGWIGLEAAAGLRKLGMEVVVVEAADQLCGRVLTPEMGQWMLKFHTGHGVDVRLGTGVERFEGNGRVERAILGDGSVVETPLAVIGIGVIPNTELAGDAGLELDNGIVVDDMGRTSDADIFAAGDVSNHPNALFGRRVRLESWENAQNQAIAAARAMLGKGEPYAEIPWFWSDQYDVNLQLIGLPDGWDETVTRGDPAASPEGPFCVFYLKGGRIDGGVAVNNGRDLRFAKRLMQAGKPVTAAELADTDIKMQALLKR
jgi:3-phenylpropionate/trans-cinnamate dioxygenase ferredoxin reductase subunit